VDKNLARVLEEALYKILLATDGSTFSEVAEKTVTAMIRPQDAEVLVLEAVEPLMFTAPPQMAPGYAPEQAARMQEIVDLAKKTTELTAARLRSTGFKVDSRVVESDSATASWTPPRSGSRT
jgi:nucleotide-binding universal stress UspA family protein